MRVVVWAPAGPPARCERVDDFIDGDTTISPPQLAALISLPLYFLSLPIFPLQPNLPLSPAVLPPPPPSPPLRSFLFLFFLISSSLPHSDGSFRKLFRVCQTFFFFVCCRCLFVLGGTQVPDTRSLLALGLEVKLPNSFAAPRPKKTADPRSV